MMQEKSTTLRAALLLLPRSHSGWGLAACHRPERITGRMLRDGCSLDSDWRSHGSPRLSSSSAWDS